MWNGSKGADSRSQHPSPTRCIPSLTNLSPPYFYLISALPLYLIAKIFPAPNAQKHMSLKQPGPLPILSSMCFSSFENVHFETFDLFQNSFIPSFSSVPLLTKKNYFFKCVCSMLLSIASAPCFFQLSLLQLF